MFRVDLEHGRHRGDRADDDAEPSRSDPRGGGAQGEVPAALCQLLEREALALGRERPDRLDHQLVGRE